MEISNFRDYERRSSIYLRYKYIAVIDVTTGFLWWKRTEARKIGRGSYTPWFFMEGCDACPDDEVRRLEAPLAFDRGWLGQ